MTTQLGLPLHDDSVPDPFDSDDVVRPFPVNPAPGDEPGNTTWEYQVLYGGSSSTEALGQLNLLGADGWELVAVVPPQSASGQTVLYMKRRALT